MQAYKYNDRENNIRYEILDGEIVLMAPSPTIKHSDVMGNIYAIFKNYLKGKKCRVFSDNLDVYLDEKNIVQPDVKIVCNPDILKERRIEGAPDLVVEVLSPSTAKKDKGYKKDLYERFGVKEYWIVEISNCSIEVYLLKDGSMTLDNIYQIYPDYEIESLKEEGKLEEIVKEFKTSLFDDLIISVEDVFDKII